MTTITMIKPDAAMVYAGLVLRLRAQGLPQRLRTELQTKARKIRKTLTEYELTQAHRLIGV